MRIAAAKLLPPPPPPRASARRRAYTRVRLSSVLGALLLLLLQAAGTARADTLRVGAGAHSDPAIAFLEHKVQADPEDVVALNMLVGRYLDHLRDGGDDRDLQRAQAHAKRSLEVLHGNVNPAGAAAQISVDQAAHRFEQARAGAAALVQALPGKSGPHKQLGDALLELGREAEAADAFARARAIEGSTVDTESRAARLAIVRGQTAQARRHLQSALTLATTMSLPSPELIAWCFVQLGQFDFSHGNWVAAAANYKRALKAQPTSLLASEHLAELAAAKGDYSHAIAAYRDVLSRSARPEFRQALGDMYRYAKQPEQAARWYAEALAGYMVSINAGHVHYQHHLAGFFTDSQPDGAAAVRWAKADLALRKSGAAYDAYAWALYTHGRFGEADAAARKALATGTQDAHVLYHAGLIATRAGDIARGAAMLRRALKSNPRYNSFHVHR